MVFVTKIFIKEINYILQAIYSLDNFKPKLPPPSTTTTKPSQPLQVINENPPAKIFYDINIEVGKIEFTAITPTYTALSICTGERNMAFMTNNFLKNNNKYFTNEYTLKPSVEAKCDISVNLKACYSKENEIKLKRKSSEASHHHHQQQPSIDEPDYDDWYQLASFDTKIDLKNAIRMLSKEHDREAIIITIDKPRFYLQLGAVDNAILFWLNYKSTYEAWLNKRPQYAEVAPNYPQQQNFKQQNLSNESENNFLALKLRVSSLGLAIPLSNKPTKDFKTNTDCIVITLNDTSIYACSSGCVVSKGQFVNFCLRFVEDFDLASADWMPYIFNDHNNTYFNTLFNSWLVPSGSYEVCSSTIQNTIESSTQTKTSLLIVSCVLFFVTFFFYLKN